jgi:uncharacterized protein (TIGR03435 family)
LLADRFHLEVHHETRELPVFALTVAGDATKTKETKCVNDSPTASNSCQPSFRTDSGSGSIRGRSAPMPEFASILESITGRVVLDRTSTSGRYDIDMKWTPDSISTGDVGGPSLVTALQEQLGLKLESTKGPVETLVIDHVEKPSEN